MWPSSVNLKAASPRSQHSPSHVAFPHLPGNRSSLEHRLTFSFAELPIPLSCWSQQPPRFHNGHQGLVECVTGRTRPRNFPYLYCERRKERCRRRVGKLFVPARKLKNTFRPWPKVLQHGLHVSPIRQFLLNALGRIFTPLHGPACGIYRHHERSWVRHFALCIE